MLDYITLIIYSRIITENKTLSISPRPIELAWQRSQFQSRVRFAWSTSALKTAVRKKLNLLFVNVREINNVYSIRLKKRNID